MTIIIFTQSYPYDFTTEHIFASPEIPYLAEKFKRIILIPRACKGKRLPFPSGVEVDERYADFLRRNSRPHRMIQLALTSRSFFQEIHNHPSILLYPSKILKLILFSSRVALTREWLTNFIRTRQINPNDCILYSYWFDHAAAALAMVRQEFPGIRAVSRAHGYDIYDEYYYPYYWPYRHETLNGLDMLFFASEAGENYFRERYPEFASKYETAHLGVENPGSVSCPSKDGVFRIVSCSHIVGVKRLELLVDGIASAARQRREQSFEWVHFGDGHRRKALEKKIARNFPPNIKGRFLGHMPNSQIIQYYSEHACDVFVNVSQTEGGAPISIQEAISCGIPIVASSVGGNPEIVSEKNGILLSPNPTPEEIAAALLKIWDNPLLSEQMRKESRQVWQENYNAAINFSLFAERLRAIRTGA